jgi:hypothetical protein
MGMTVTVGNCGADFNGADDMIIQAAIEYVAARGGGTVKLGEGTYRLSNSVRLRSGIELVGSGPETLLIKQPAATVAITEDLDWYEKRVTVADASPFKVGCGVLLQGPCPHSGALQITITTVVGIEGNTLHLLDAGRGADAPAHVGNFWTDCGATASTLFSLVTANWAHDVRVADLRVDGNWAESSALNGNYGGALYFQDCQRVHLQRLEVGNIESDGLSFQIVDDLIVEDCKFANCSQGIHAGSGSQRPIIRNNTVMDCPRFGMAWCWGVKGGVLEGNLIEHCGTASSIGHRDTDSIIRNNIFRDCGGGLAYRDDPQPQAAHDNLIEGNTFENMGTAQHPGYAVEMLAPVHGNVFRDNRFTGRMKAAFLIGEQVENVMIEGNVLEGVEAEIEDLRRG